MNIPSLIRSFLSLISAVVVVCESVDITEYPHHVAFIMTNTQKLFCSGSILNNWFIITAAECLYQKEHLFPNIRMFVGTSNLNNRRGTGYAIESITVHPHYNPLRSQNAEKLYNIALVKSTIAIIFDPRQNRIRLPSSDIALGQVVTVISWEFEDRSASYPPLVMKKMDSEIRSRIDSRTHYRSPFKNSQFTTCDAHETNVYEGNVGGSVIYNNKLVGVVSESTLCNQGVCSNNVNIYSSLGFIWPIISQRQLI